MDCDFNRTPVEVWLRPHEEEPGNFLPLHRWLPGQPQPPDWPSHIHAPKEVYDWAKANKIDWRTLLDTPRVEAKQTKEVVWAFNP